MCCRPECKTIYPLCADTCCKTELITQNECQSCVQRSTGKCTPAPTPMIPSLCSSVHECKRFFNSANMSEIAAPGACCSTDFRSVDSCNGCFHNMGLANDDKYLVNSYYNYEHIGTSISIDNNTILLKDNNLIITDGSNAALILLDSSNITYIDSKLYEQQQTIESCPPPQQSSDYVCPQIFSNSTSLTMRELDQVCCSFSYESGCQQCLENKAGKLGITYQFKELETIGTSIPIDEIKPTVLLKGNKLVITNGGTNAIAVELSLNL